MAKELPPGWKRVEKPNTATALPEGWGRVDAPPVKEEEAWYEDFGEGLVTSGKETYYGIKDLTIGLGDDDAADLKDWRDDAGESGWGTVGQVVGDIGQMVIPGAMGLKAAKIGSSLTKQAIAGGLLAGIQAPDEALGEHRIYNALGSAGGSVLGGGLLKGLGVLAKGINKTPAAQKILNRGDYLTPGEASRSSLPKAMQTLMQVTPTLAKGTKELETKAANDWLVTTANKVGNAFGVKLHSLSRGNMDRLKEGVEIAYKKAWTKNTTQVGQYKINRVEKILKEQGEIGLPAETLQEGTRILNALKKLRGTSNSEKLRRLDEEIKDNIAKYAGDKKVYADMFREMKKVVRANLDDGATADLAMLDAAYPAYKTLASAAHGAFGGNKITLEGLKNASISTSTKGYKAAFGKAPIQDEIELGLKTIGQEQPNVIFNWIKGVAQNVSSPTKLLKGTGEVLLGQKPWQKELYGTAKRYGLPQTLAQIRRKYNLGAGTMGAGYEQ